MNNVRVGSHHQLPRPKSRTFILLVLALIVATFGVIDQRVGRPKSSVGAPVVGAAPAGAVSSAWYCPLLASSPTTPAASSVIVLNPQNQALTGTITFVDSGGLSADVAVNIAPRSRQSFSPGASVPAPYASALVRLAGGGATVEQYIHDANGDAATPCAPSASKSWYFADGTTEAGSALEIGVFNPFNENAIVDASFLTSEGVAEPQSFQGVVIPPMKMVVLDISGNVRRRDFVATSLTLRSGRAVAAQLQTGVLGGHPMVGYTVGQPTLALTQYIPDVETPAGRLSRLSLYNPSDVESEVEVNSLLDSGSAPPFDLHVPANGRVSVEFDSEARIPANSRLAVAIRVKNSVPVASQLTVTTVAPAPTTGGAFLTPSVTPANQWMLASGGIAANSDVDVIVVNPGATIATAQITLTGNGNSSAQTPVKIAPGRRAIVRINDLSPNGAAGVVVNSDQPVVVGREIDVPPGPNFSIAPATAVRR